MDIKKLAEAEEENLISLRRHFHTHPELSQKEFATMDFIEEKLHALSIPTVRVPQGGVFGFLDSGKPGWTVLMRSDIDALPILEDEKNLARKKVCISENPGVSHACGHDAHMAMLLTEAKILAEHKDEWEGKIVLMFEEAEEMGERGVGHVLRYLARNKIHIDVCYGTHMMYCLRAGKTAAMYGGVLAGAFFFRAVIHGKSGHGSRPDQAVSPIDCFTAFSQALSSYRMRKVSPANSLTYSFGMVRAGDTPNVIPDTLEFAGTARCFVNEDGLAFRDEFWNLLEDTAKHMGCTAEIVDDQYFPVTANTKECVDLARRVIPEAAGDILEDTEPWMASETFSITSSCYPGIFLFTGIRDEELGTGGNHHTPEFDVAEYGMKYGVMAALAYVLGMLREKPEISSFKKKDLEEMLAMAACTTGDE